MSDTSLSLPDPSDRSRSAVWSGKDFVIDNRHQRVLAYDVSPSGWTDELTHLHEETGGSNHFIDIASRRYACAEVMRCITRASASILEIGCSSGFLLRELITLLPGHLVFGADYTRETLELLGRKLLGVPLIQFDLTQCPLPDDFVDVIVLLNVLEHIDDHETAMAQLFRVVRPGGAVIIEVPAGPSLFDVYDRVLMHERRYAMSSLTQMAQKQGFYIERRSHLGFFIYPAFYLSKRLNQWRYPAGGDVNEWQLVAGMIKATRKSNSIMNAAMWCEQALRRYVYLPFGVRCLITCRKRDGQEGFVPVNSATLKRHQTES